METIDANEGKWERGQATSREDHEKIMQNSSG